jgi:hypothetical protein
METEDELRVQLEIDEGRGVPVTPVTVTDGLSVDHLPYHRWAAVVTECALPHTAYFEWSTETDLADLRDSALATGRTKRGETAFVDIGDALVYVALHRGRVTARAAAYERTALDAAEAWLRARVPEVQESEEPRVSVEFWTQGRGGPYSVHRRIDVPAWEAVASNYPKALRATLAPLISGAWRPTGDGRLLLWHGPPGTGKTHALRALAWEWRAWCAMHYITDPEVFFGSSEYMLDVLTSGDDDDDDDDGDDAERERWRLLVLEDTGELLTADAKERTGQGLSRFLNVVDGLIGQGLRVLVLVTTNESLGSLHAAVARPGRCAVQIEYGAFPAGEAAEWLASHGHEALPQEAETLATLYGRLSGFTAPRQRPAGFRIS